MTNAQLILRLKEYKVDLQKHLKDMKISEKVNACIVLSELDEKINNLIKEVEN
jgi:hypothetical protein